MLNNKKAQIQNKKAQVGETVTWMVAILIIIVIVIISVIVAGLGELAKNIFNLDNKIVVASSDRIAEKSFYNYLLTPYPGGGNVYLKIRTEGNLEEEDKFSGELASEIFKGFYEKNYPMVVWLGTGGNYYFGSRPSSVRGDFDPNIHYLVDYVSSAIYLDENKYLELILMNK